MFFVKRGKQRRQHPFAGGWCTTNPDPTCYMAAQTQHVLLGPRCEINNLARVNQQLLTRMRQPHRFADAPKEPNLADVCFKRLNVLAYGWLGKA
jgi:hypothetical protein